MANKLLSLNSSGNLPEPNYKYSFDASTGQIIKEDMGGTNYLDSLLARSKEPREQTLPYGGGTYNPAGTSEIKSAPIFAGNNRAPAPAPAPTPAPASAPAEDSFYDKYRNPKTGEIMSPDEWAVYLGNKVPKGTGEISNYAGDAMTNPDQTSAELTARARDLNISRNDIATGTTDPYGVGNKSGIAYSPTQLKAIENAYAGIYDPALNDVFSRLKEKDDADKEALTRRQMLEEKAIEHKYRMAEKTSTGTGSKLTGPSSYQEWVLAGEQQGTGKTYYEYLQGAATGQSFKSEIATTGREAVQNMQTIAERSPGIFGRTASMWVPDAARSDDFRNYSAQLDSLRGNIIPAALTAMREASTTGGALGQVSDREGTWLSASLGALEMNQSPTQIKAQLEQIDKHLANWQNAVIEYSEGESNNKPSSMELNGQILTLQDDGTYE